MARDPRYDIPFEPVRIGPVTTKNRFYQVPHCNGMGHRLPRSTAAMRGIKAEGGRGVVCTEECEIHPSGDVWLTLKAPVPGFEGNYIFTPRRHHGRRRTPGASAPGAGARLRRRPLLPRRRAGRETAPRRARGDPGHPGAGRLLLDREDPRDRLHPQTASGAGGGDPAQPRGGGVPGRPGRARLRVHRAKTRALLRLGGHHRPRACPRRRFFARSWPNPRPWPGPASKA